MYIANLVTVCVVHIVSPVVTPPQQGLTLAVEQEPPALHGLLAELVIILDLLQQPGTLHVADVSRYQI